MLRIRLAHLQLITNSRKRRTSGATANALCPLYIPSVHGERERWLVCFLSPEAHSEWSRSSGYFTLNTVQRCSSTLRANHCPVVAHHPCSIKRSTANTAWVVVAYNYSSAFRVLFQKNSITFKFKSNQWMSCNAEIFYPSITFQIKILVCSSHKLLYVHYLIKKLNILLETKWKLNSLKIICEKKSCVSITNYLFLCI